MSGQGQIETDCPMRRALLDGVNGYTPVFRGETLIPEYSDNDASLKNVRRMLSVGLKICGLNVGPNGNVLVIFDSGETYLATGFAVGEYSLLVQALAEIAVESGLGKMRDWMRYLTTLPSEGMFSGPLQIPPPSHDLKLRPFTG